MILSIICNDFKNKCGNCKYFKTDNHIDGECINTQNKVKIRQRYYNSKCCSYKEIKK